MSKLKKKF